MDLKLAGGLVAEYPPFGAHGNHCHLAASKKAKSLRIKKNFNSEKRQIFSTVQVYVIKNCKKHGKFFVYKRP